MILYIDTTDFDGLRFALIEPAMKKLVKDQSRKVAYNENYKTAEFLMAFLKTTKTSLKNLTKIVVCSGPGSFTGIRVGVALAQAMGYTLDIPTIAIKKPQVPDDLRKLISIRGGKTTTLNYGMKPNITKPKKRK